MNITELAALHLYNTINRPARRTLCGDVWRLWNGRDKSSRDGHEAIVHNVCFLLDDLNGWHGLASNLGIPDEEKYRYKGLVSLKWAIDSKEIMDAEVKAKTALIVAANPFKEHFISLPTPDGGVFGNFYSLLSLDDPRIDKLPYSIRILLESAIRNCDNFHVTEEDVEKIIDWENTSTMQVEIPFKPARVLLQGFAIPKEAQGKVVKFDFHGQQAELKHGSVVIAEITSCMNKSNPIAMLEAGIVARKADRFPLRVKPWVKTILAPGSEFVTKCLTESGLDVLLKRLGFDIDGFGCTTCIGNLGDLHETVASAISENDIVAAAFGNSNFEGQVHPSIRANYLVSPALVVAYALAGTVDIDFEKEPIGTGKDGKNVYLRDIWPSTEEIAETVQSSVLPDMFLSTYESITKGNPMWNKLQVPANTLYSWDPNSTYIHEPPYFKNMTLDPPGSHGVKGAYCLLNFGDGIPIDHISPAGSINKDSPAAKYLLERGVDHNDLNSYRSRRGNDEVMARGTFANIFLVNKLLNGEVGPRTIHIPTGEELYVFDAAMSYKASGQDTIVLAGAGAGFIGTSTSDKFVGIQSGFNRVHKLAIMNP